MSGSISPSTNSFAQARKKRFSGIEHSWYFRCISLLVGSFSLDVIVFIIINFYVVVTMVTFCYFCITEKDQRGLRAFYYSVTAIPLSTLYFFGLHLRNVGKRYKLVAHLPDDKRSIEISKFDVSTLFTLMMNITSSIIMIVLEKIIYSEKVAAEALVYLVLFVLVFLVFWTMIYRFARQMCIEIHEFRGPTMNEFIDKAIRIYSWSALLEVFFIMAMMSEQMSASYSNLSIPEIWSAGYATLGCSFTISATCVTWTYSFGAGLVEQADFNSSKSVISTESKEAGHYETIRNTLVKFLYSLAIAELLGFLASASMTWTTYNAESFYYAVIIGFCLWIVAGFIITALRSLGPKSIKSLLWIHEKNTHFFISHAQGTGGDQVHSITKELQSRNCLVWWDQELDNQITEEAMKRGIEDSLAVIVFLTKGSMNRRFTQLEVRHAMNLNKNFIVIIELDPRHNGYDSIDQCIYDMDDEFKSALCENSEIITYSRRKYLSDAMYDEILERLKSFFT